MARAQGSLKKSHIKPKPDPDSPKSPQVQKVTPPKKTVLKEGWKSSRILQTFLEDFLGVTFWACGRANLKRHNRVTYSHINTPTDQ